MEIVASARVRALGRAAWRGAVLGLVAVVAVLPPRRSHGLCR
jgi:hypothetical protein